MREARSAAGAASILVNLIKSTADKVNPLVTTLVLYQAEIQQMHKKAESSVEEALRYLSETSALTRQLGMMIDQQLTEEKL